MESAGPGHSCHVCSGLTPPGREDLREFWAAQGTVIGTKIKCGKSLEIQVKCVCAFEVFTSVLLFIKAVIEDSSSSSSGAGEVMKANTAPQVYDIGYLK